MAREISIIIRARNAMAAGIASASRSLQAFGASAMKIGKWFAAGFLAAGTAVVGFAVKALSAYSVQERATQQLSSAIRAFGEDVEKTVPSLLDMASAIQDETGAADEATVATMARLKLLGVLTPKLGDAAKAVIALKSVGMEEAAASKAVAMAMNGQYDMLNRYVPALRTATSEAEKAQIVNDLISRGYQQQRDSLGTVGGAWAALKGRIGDAWEEVGKAISQNAGLVSILTKAGDAVKTLGIRFAEWASGGGITNAIATAKLMFEDLKFGFEKTGAYVTIVASSIMDGFSSAFNYVANIGGKWKDQIVAQFSYVADYIKAVWEKIKAPSSTFEPPSIQPMLDAMVAFKDSYKEWDTVTERTDAAFQTLEKMNEDHAARVKTISDEQLAGLATNADSRVDAEVEAMDRIEIAEANHISEMDKLNAKREYSNEVQAAKNAEKVAVEEAKKALEKKDKLKELFLDKDARRLDKERERQEKKDEARIKRALEAGEKGLKGAHIDRAIALMEAVKAAQEAADREALAKMDVMDREAALKEAMDAMAESSKNIEKNTEDTALGLGTLSEAIIG